MENIILKSHVLFSFKSDVMNRTVLDWLKSHTSFMLPLHKFQGEMKLTDDTLVIFLEKSTKITLTRSDIADIFLGFDEIYSKSQDRSRGISFKPLRITTVGNEVMYLIADFSRITRSSSNAVWYNTLAQWMNQD